MSLAAVMTRRLAGCASFAFATLALTACGKDDITAAGTEAALRGSMTVRSVECRPGAGDWDYLCHVDFGAWESEIGVDVDDDSITAQTAP